MLADRVRMGSGREKGIKCLFYVWTMSGINERYPLTIKDSEGKTLAELTDVLPDTGTPKPYGGYFYCEIGVDYYLYNFASMAMTPGFAVRYNDGAINHEIIWHDVYRPSRIPPFLTFEMAGGSTRRDPYKIRFDYLPENWDGVSEFRFELTEQD